MHIRPIVGVVGLGLLVSCGLPSSETPAAMMSSLDMTAGRFPVDGGELYYEVAGSGEPLVLIHGNAGDLRHWDSQVETLADEYRVIRYDVRGFGRSSGSVPGEPFSHHGDVAALLADLGIPAAHLMGWSMGSGIAIDFALAHPEMAMSVISVGPWVNGYSSEATSQMNAELAAVRTAAIEGGNAAAVDAWMAAPLFAATIRDPRAGDRFRHIASAQSFLPSEGPSPLEPLRPSAATRTVEIDVPMLIVTAEYDILACREIADLLEQTVGNARRITLEGTGHLMHMERAGEFNAIVLDFLASMRRG